MAATDLNLEATELRFGLPGSQQESEKNPSCRAEMNTNKKTSSEMGKVLCQQQEFRAPSPKAQVVGWPPVGSYRKNVLSKTVESDASGIFVKVSMNGAPYLRKIDLSSYRNYLDLLKAMESMFKCTIGVYSEREEYNGSEFAPTYG